MGKNHLSNNINELYVKKIIKKIIFEIEDNQRKILSIDQWSDIWLKLRKEYGEMFIHPEFIRQYDMENKIFTAMNIDFTPKNDGEYLEVIDFLKNPKNWHEDYDKGVKTLEKIENKLRDKINNSNCNLYFESDDNFNFKIYKK